MNKLAVSLLAGAAALVAGSAQAAPLFAGAPALDSNIENVRMVCDQYGRCWRERGPRRMMIQQDSYNSYNSYEPGYRRQGYYRQAPAPGVQLNVPGVSIGLGGGRW